MNRIRDVLKVNPVSAKVATIGSRFESKVYLVGGLVRDIIMGRESDSLDIDIAVDGNPEDLARIINQALGGHIFPISRDFDTWRIVSAHSQPDKFSIDITALREATIEEDLLERDFSINSIAIDLSSFSDGEYIRLLDPRNGINDIASGLIRSVDDLTFERDPIRLIRALRFENVLGFDIEEQTAQFIKEKASLISNVSGERLRDEIVQVLHKGDAAHFFKRLNAFSLLTTLFPLLSREVKDTSPLLRRVEDIVRNIPSFLSQYGKEISDYFDLSIAEPLLKSDILILSAFIVSYCTADAHVAARSVAERLKLGNRGERLLWLSLNKPRSISNKGSLDKRSIYNLLINAGDATIIRLFLSIAEDLIKLGDPLPEKSINGYKAIFDFLFNEYRLRETPLLNGEDIMTHLNLSPGPDIGRLLKLIEEEYILGSISNREEALKYLETI